MTIQVKPRATIGSAVAATYIAFAANGFAFASWASRIPQVKHSLGLDPAALGAVLLAIAGGSVIGLPLAGPVVARFGSRRTLTTAAVLVGTGFTIVAAGYHAGTPMVVAGLFVYGIATGAWDVAMNVQGAAVERGLGRSIMPRFHAAFSLGTVAGALGGAAMVALGVGVTVHLTIVSVAVAAIVAVAAQRFIGDQDQEQGRVSPGGAALRAWRERRTLLIGVFVLAFAFAEGAGNDWISVATIEERHFQAAVGALAFGAFLAAMTVGRWAGPWLLDRYGRVPVVRGLLGAAVTGLLVFVFGGGAGPVATFAGVVLWGGGISLGFPVGMSAGADEPPLAAPRVGVISSISYCAFMAGPPLIGLLAQRTTIVHALASVTALLLLAALIAPAVRPPRAQKSSA